MITETVTVNGEARNYRRQTIAEILTEYGLDPTRPGIAVAVNGTVARRAEWPRARPFRSGAVVERHRPGSFYPNYIHHLVPIMYSYKKTPPLIGARGSRR